MRVLVVLAVLLAVGVAISALLTVGWQRDIDLSQAPTETINEILAMENTSLGQKQRALDALAQRDTQEAFQSIVKFINEAGDTSEETILLKTRAIDSLVSSGSPNHIRAAADLLKTQAHPEIRQHIVRLLSKVELSQDSALTLADTLSRIRSRDALLVMANRLGIDKDEEVRIRIKETLKSSVATHLLPRLGELSEAMASDSERQEIEDIVTSIERNAAESKESAAIFKETSPEVLREILDQEGNGGVILLALQRLEKIGSPEAVQTISYFVKERKLPRKLQYLYRNAIASLCRIESEESIELLGELYAHPPTEKAREQIIEFLGDFARKEESLNFLKQLDQQELPPDMKKALEEATRKMEKRLQ